jgi:hypothetical protein
MQVTLRIVGIFFNKKVEIDDTVKTVKDVMDAYRRNGNDKTSKIGGLRYIIEPKDNTIKKISFNFDGKYDFQGDSPANGKGKTLGGQTLPPRVYSLRERSLGKNSQLAWQYYVIDKNGKNKSRTLQAKGFTPFGKNPANYTIEAGDTIIWRLVAINYPKDIH